MRRVRAAAARSPACGCSRNDTWSRPVELSSRSVDLDRDRGIRHREGGQFGAHGADEADAAGVVRSSVSRAASSSTCARAGLDLGG